MKKMDFVFKSLVSVILAVLLVVPVNAQEQQAEDDGQISSNELRYDTIRTLLLNDFEAAEDWRAYATSPLGTTKIKKIIQRGYIEDVFNPKELSDEERNKFQPGSNHVLGVKTYFKEKGYDRVEVKPPQEYSIRGIGRQFSVWALGRSFRHTLFVKVRDYTGRIHHLRLGRLDYLGWRKLTVTVPGWIPQSTRYALLDRNLRFVSLFVTSDYHEVQGEFYFYLDELTMKVDKTEMDYPGSEITDTW